MADNEKEGEGTTSRGADWEVVSLTASAYAAAPSAQEIDSIDESTEKVNSAEQDSSGAMFMSGHFVFPPSEHENLPIEPDLEDVHGETEDYDISSYMQDDTEINNDLHRVEYEEGSTLSVHDVGFREGKGFQSLNLEEQNAFTELEYDPIEASQEALESPEKYAKQKEEKNDNLPCEAWWKRHAATFYRQAKEANTFWSIVVAAAVMGLVILGQRWHRDKWQLHQPKWRFSIRR